MYQQLVHYQFFIIRTIHTGSMGCITSNPLCPSNISLPIDEDTDTRRLPKQNGPGCMYIKAGPNVGKKPNEICKF